MMKIEAQKVQNSFSSIQYQAGRFPKVSIGITVDEHQMTGSNHARKDDYGALPPLRRTLSQEKVIEEKNKPVTIRPVEEKQVVNEKQRAAISSSSERQETPTMKPFHFRAKHISALQSEEGGGKKSDDVVYRRSSGNNKTMEEAAMQEIRVQGTRSSVKSDKVPSCNTEALRTKLWEILGVSTQEKQTANSPGPDDSSKHSNIDPKDKSQMAEAAKHKENSDTIEDDTESPNQTVKRPITRSLSKKKAAPKTVPKMQHDLNHTRKSLSSSRGMKLKFQENIFSFDEREARGGSSGCAIKGQSSSSNRKKIERKKAGIDPQKESFPQETQSEKCRQTNEKNQIVKPAIKASSQSKNARDPLCRPCQSKEVSGTDEVRKSNQTFEASNADGKGNQTSRMDARENVNSLPLGNSKEIPENADSIFLKVKTKSCESLKTPSVRRNENLQKKPTSPPWTRNIDPVDDFQSPTLAMDGTPPLSASKTPDKGLFNPGLAQAKTFGRRLFSSRSSDDSRPNSGSEMDTESSDNSGGISPLLNTTVGQVAEKEIEKPLSQSPTEERNAGSFEADTVANKGFKLMDGSSGNATSRKKYPFSLRHTKRLHNLEDLKIGKIELSSPAPSAPSRTHKTTIANEASDLYPEDSLERATVQLALILERFKAKIKSHTSKKSSEILMSAADKLCVKLQDVESEIQADFVKFASASKLKRKHLEAKFEDQQEQLRSVHDKFKEDVNQHLLDYKNNIEEFQADQMELKASVEKQKTSHKKLLLQVEEQMKVQLHDAETSILAVHKEARKKMKGLKYVLREFIEGGMFS